MENNSKNCLIKCGNEQQQQKKLLKLLKSALKNIVQWLTKQILNSISSRKRFVRDQRTVRPVLASLLNHQFRNTKHKVKSNYHQQLVSNCALKWKKWNWKFRHSRPKMQSYLTKRFLENIPIRIFEIFRLFEDQK